MKQLLSYLFIGLLSVSAIAADVVQSVNTKGGEKMTIWIDVRTAEEFAQGHVQGAINIPYELIGGEISAITRDVDSDIRVYCRSGNRSGIAKNTLNGLGFANVINEGGYESILQRKATGEKLP